MKFPHLVVSLCAGNRRVFGELSAKLILGQDTMAIPTPIDLELPRCRLGEAAFWDDSGRLLWTDILGQKIYIYHLGRKELSHADTRLPVSFAFLAPSEHTITAGLADGIYQLDIHNGSEELIAGLDLPANHRLNDGKCGPLGRLWVGTIDTSEDPSGTAALYRLTSEGLLDVEDGYENANGKGWSPDGTVMYHADTARGIVWRYDYDAESGAIANRRVFVQLEGENPDGLAVDVEGNVYAAIYGGSCVAVYSPRGDEVERIPLPVPNVTSCAFGGDNLQTLFITTAYDGMDSSALETAPLSGHVFAVRRDIPGVPCPLPVIPVMTEYRGAAE